MGIFQCTSRCEWYITTTRARRQHRHWSRPHPPVQAQKRPLDLIDWTSSKPSEVFLIAPVPDEAIERPLNGIAEVEIQFNCWDDDYRKALFIWAAL